MIDEESSSHTQCCTTLLLLGKGVSHTYGYIVDILTPSHCLREEKCDGCGDKLCNIY